MVISDIETFLDQLAHLDLIYCRRPKYDSHDPAAHTIGSYIVLLIQRIAGQGQASKELMVRREILCQKSES